MFSELVDQLRCLEPHEESWLVAVAHRNDGRHIVDGELGCPVCRARYPIVGGVADFTRGAPPVSSAATAGEVDADDALKLAAMLDLAEPRGWVLLAGEWAGLTPALREIAPVSVIAVDAPATLDRMDGVAELRVSGRVPVARGAARAAALGAGAGALAASAVESVRGGGRVVGVASLPVPDDVDEIARDERHWVGVRRGADGPLLKLVRNPG